MSFTKILNIKIDSVSKQFFLESLTEGVVVTPNVDHLMLAQSDEEFYSLYLKADYRVCDSKVLKLCSYFLKDRIKEVIAGSDLLMDFCLFHRKNDKIKIFLLGAAPGVADSALKEINAKIGRDIVAGAFSPSYGFEINESECQEIVNRINSSRANVLVVGLGAPKQEKWIFKYRNMLPGIKIFLPLGAAIDFAAGNKKRAPKIWRKLALEWLYRLLQEPSRLWRRYLLTDTKFFYLFVLQLVNFYRNPFSNKN